MNCLQKRAVKEENEKGTSEMARSIYEEKTMLMNTFNTKYKH